jgi:hypothetical protein
MTTKISDYLLKRDELKGPPEDIPNEIFLQSRGVLLAPSSLSNDATSVSNQDRAPDSNEKTLQNAKEAEEAKNDLTADIKKLQDASHSSSAFKDETFDFNNVEKTKKRSSRGGYSSTTWTNIEK